jgi:hypothetical protein
MMGVFQQGGGPGGSITISMQGRGMEAVDISKIVLLGPREAKKVGIVLDAQPRAMMLNTLYSKNIPGDITMPVNEIIKTKGNSKEFTGEEILATMPLFTEPSEIIVDNEDPGFSSSRQNTVSPLKKLLGIKNKDGNTYMQVSVWNVPEYWQRVVQSTYYGKYVRSAVYTRAGTGDKTVTWSAVIKEPDYYDVYCYVGKATGRTMRPGRAGGPGGPGGGPGGQGGQGGQSVELQADNPYKEMHYKVFHDEGVEDLTLDYENAEGGWNLLGRYYLSPDTAKVVLTNQSTGRNVIGDAIKWVKQN